MFLLLWGQCPSDKATLQLAPQNREDKGQHHGQCNVYGRLLEPPRIAYNYKIKGLFLELGGFWGWGHLEGSIFSYEPAFLLQASWHIIYSVFWTLKDTTMVQRVGFAQCLVLITPAQPTLNEVHLMFSESIQLEYLQVWKGVDVKDSYDQILKKPCL